jgi:hypothetical protein
VCVSLFCLLTAYVDCRTHTLAERPSFVVDTVLMRIAPEVVELLEYPGYLYGILMFVNMLSYVCVSVPGYGIISVCHFM